MAFYCSRTVYLGDTDAAGVVYFASGMQMCHEAYEESLAKAGISLGEMLIARKIALPIVHGAINFFNPIFCSDKLQIDLVAEQIKDSEFTIAYKIFSASNLEKILVTATTSHVCINPITRKRMELSTEILNWLEVTNTKSQNVENI